MSCGCSPVALAPALTVRWVSGEEVLTLFKYDPETHQFNEVQPGIANGRASIANGPAEVAIQGETVLRMIDGAIEVFELFADGAVMAGEPRLEFLSGVRRLATLSKAGLRVTWLIEDEPVAGGNQFEFYGDSGLVAALGINGLTVSEVVERDDAVLVSQSLEGGAVVSPGQEFTCEWVMRNTGATTWWPGGVADGYSFNAIVISDGIDFGELTSVPPEGPVEPGDLVTFRKTFVAPFEPGSYGATYQMVNDDGDLFGEQAVISIVVS